MVSSCCKLVLSVTIIIIIIIFNLLATLSGYKEKMSPDGMHATERDVDCTRHHDTLALATPRRAYTMTVNYQYTTGLRPSPLLTSVSRDRQERCLYSV